MSEVRDHGNEALDRTISAKLSFEWPGLTKLSMTHQDSRIRLRPQEVPSLDERAAFDHDRSGVELATSFSRYLTLTLKGSTGGDV